MIYDLHVHTTASDGAFTPSEVLAMAQEMGLAGLAITDHDTVSGLEEAYQQLSQHDYSLKFIPGIEMNTEVDETEVHILGYYVNRLHQPLLSRLQEIKHSRLERAQRMISRLRSMGLVIQFDQVQKLARGDSIGRPHVAQALLEKGYVFSIKEAFEKYIGKGKPAYIPRYKFLPEEAIELIFSAGGIPVLAHPGLIRDKLLITAAIRLGIQGIEVYYPEHTYQQVEEYLQLSRTHHLLVTGGSDFHGFASDHSRSRLGCSGIHEELFKSLALHRGN